jgi:hypothetical protein
MVQALLLLLVVAAAAMRAEATRAEAEGTLRGAAAAQLGADARGDYGRCPAKCLYAVFIPKYEGPYGEEVVVGQRKIEMCEGPCQGNCEARLNNCALIKDQWNNWVVDRACSKPIYEECKPRCTAQLTQVGAPCVSNFEVTRTLG